MGTDPLGMAPIREWVGGFHIGRHWQASRAKSFMTPIPFACFLVAAASDS